MKTKLLLLFVLVTLSARAQDIQQRIYKSAEQEMLVLVNYEVVGGMDLLKHLHLKRFQQSALIAKNSWRPKKTSSRITGPTLAWSLSMLILGFR